MKNTQPIGDIHTQYCKALYEANKRDVWADLANGIYFYFHPLYTEA